MNGMDSNPTTTILATPTSNQDSLSPLADEDMEMLEEPNSPRSHGSQFQKGVRIDNHYYFEDGEKEPIKEKHRRGISDYQAAWYISDSGESEDDDGSEIEMDDVYEGEVESEMSYHEEEQSDTGDAPSEMHIDLSPEEEARQYTCLLI